MIVVVRGLSLAAIEPNRPPPPVTQRLSLAAICQRDAFPNLPFGDSCLMVKLFWWCVYIYGTVDRNALYRIVFDYIV